MIVQVNHTQNINKMNIYITRNQSWAVVSYENSELLYWANFPGASARAPLFLKEITDAVVSYHHFTATAIRYFGASGG